MDQLILYILLVVGLSFALTMVALVDIIKKDFPTTKEKFIWHFIALVPVIGWLVYYAFGFRRGKKKVF